MQVRTALLALAFGCRAVAHAAAKVPVPLVLMFGASGATAATLLVDGSGKLTGATGVHVGGTYYGVTFHDGSCSALFSGCDSLSDFAFQTGASAQLAAQELLNQVFIDGLAGAFDSIPTATALCTYPHSCYYLTPFGTHGGYGVDFSFAHNANPQYYRDAVGTGYTNTITAEGEQAHWAVWKPSQPSVPEPSSLVLLGVGLAVASRAVRKAREH